MIGGVPALVDEAKSIFTLDAVMHRSGAFYREKGRVLKALDRITPSLALNVAAARNLQTFVLELKKRNPRPVVLVVGGAIAGKGMDELLVDDAITLVETDVSLGPRTQILCDAHDLPFADDCFDGVLVQAVLEHVANPWQCVEEVHRVLKPDGLVYAEVAFMQPVHGGRYDFCRFSRAGLLQLFRHFDELDSGVACGPGSALAYSLVYVIQSFVNPGTTRKVIGRIGRFVAWPLRYLDLVLVRRETALDGASALYFLGRRSDSPYSARELVERYRGGG